MHSLTLDRLSIAPACSNRLTAFFFAAFAMLLGGCSYRGPDAVQGTRLDYNTAVQQTTSQELLLNLVRLRFDDPVFFMSVERISSEMTFRRSVGLSALRIERGVGLSSLTSDAGSVTVEESPTMYYVPLEGELFARRVMAIMEPSTIALLIDSGLPVDRVLAVTVRTVNQLSNDPMAGQAYASFQQMIQHAATLETRRLVQIGLAQEREPRLFLRFRDGHRADPDARALRRLLGLNEDKDVFPIEFGFGDTPASRDTIFIRPHSVYSAMRDLSQGVETPPGRVTRSARHDSVVRVGELRVRVSSKRPADSALAVAYEGDWYSIPSEDRESRASFQLLSLMLRLQAGNIGVAPAPLSFSVGR